VPAAFGLSAPLARLPGGQGRTWLCEGTVLKRVDDVTEADELAEIIARLKDDARYRVTRPIRASDGRWIVDGWSAWTKLEGEHRADRWPDVLAAASALHEELAGVAKPAYVDRVQNRWRVADRIAWGESPWTPFREVGHVERLAQARRPLALPSQLVHCDLVGNVLFATGMAPGIIDHSLYWRPAGYSAAVMVGDAIAWEGAAPSLTRLLERFARWQQLLLRAVLFRVVTNAVARQAEPSRADLSRDYQEVVELAVSLSGEEK